MIVVRYIGVPRSVVDAEIGASEGWRHLGERIKTRAVELCPVAEEEDGWTGPHLRDVLELKVITGSDPRLLIGTSNPARADVLGFLTAGTDAHFVAPVNANALRWTKGGQVFFSAGHGVSGIDPHPFIIDAARQVVGEAG